MPEVYCVRAEYGTYARQFVQGNYVAIGWLDGADLSAIRAKEELYPLYRAAYPQDTNYVVGQQVGQIARFLFDLHVSDYVITPAADTELLHVGVVGDDPSYFYGGTEDGCPFKHRRRVRWLPNTYKRAAFSVPFQNTIRSSLTVFYVSQRDHFFETIGRKDLATNIPKTSHDPHEVVLEQLLQLNDREFEILIRDLLSALGFEQAEHTGKVGDGGVDVTGILNMANLAAIKLYVQVKRYKRGTKINTNTVRALRQSIPAGGQGAFITTADFQNAASDVAMEMGFPRIGLVNGRQLVDLLVENWYKLSDDLHNRLGLKLGLVVA
jgi:predicted Mrr-cat superfamily restriction endonuclease